MKKNWSYIVIVILVAVIAAMGTYIVMKEKPSNKPDTGNNSSENGSSSENNAKTGVELVSTTESGENIIQTFNAYMNGKNVPLQFMYSYKTDIDEDNLKMEQVEGTMNNIRTYFHEETMKSTSKKGSMLNKTVIDSDFSTKNFIIIKGTDNKDYLLIVTHMYDLGVGDDDLMYVFNDNLELIKPTDIAATCHDDSFVVYSRMTNIKVEENPWYSNEFNIDTSKSDFRTSSIKVKVESNQIYYLMPILKFADATDNDMGTLEERIYTINNNKLTYKTIKTYKITDAAGGAC